MGVLGHVQVLDFTSGIPGGYCARLLGGAGADVVKVEVPEGDPLRRWVTDLRDLGGEDGALFRYLHFGHRSVVAESLDEVAELLAGADVVLTDGTGLIGDPAALLAAHPHLVVTSISPFGLDGPYADLVRANLNQLKRPKSP
jgi:crotonobetainyl-CoA:carnitine CoA-transferase CaiB-like acyl-CoA transferase